MDNKRKGARESSNIRLTYRKVESILSSGSRIKDISESGLCMLADLNLPIGAVIEVRLPWHDAKDPIRTLAKVVRLIPLNDKSGFRFEIGLVFMDLSPIRWGAVRNYILSTK